MGVRSIGGLALAGVLALAGCGEAEDVTPSAQVAPGSSGDVCRLLSQGDAGSILGRGDVRPGVIAAEGVCSYGTADGSTTLVFDRETRAIFDFALSRSAQLHTGVEAVAGVPDAFYSTSIPASSPSPGLASTYLHVKAGANFYSILVQKNDTYDRDLEKKVALKLVGRS